jgi:hypothetical protein
MMTDIFCQKHFVYIDQKFSKATSLLFVCTFFMDSTKSLIRLLHTASVLAKFIPKSDNFLTGFHHPVI